MSDLPIGAGHLVEDVDPDVLIASRIEAMCKQALGSDSPDVWQDSIREIKRLAALWPDDRSQLPLNENYGKPEGDACQWVWEDPEYWATGCGEAHVFIADSPIENGYKFCPYCGKRLVEPEPEAGEEVAVRRGQEGGGDD